MRPSRGRPIRSRPSRTSTGTDASRLFQRLDADRDGFLGLPDLANLFRAFQPDCPSTVLAEAFRHFGLDQKTCIDEEDFCTRLEANRIERLEEAGWTQCFSWMPGPEARYEVMSSEFYVWRIRCPGLLGRFQETAEMGSGPSKRLRTMLAWHGASGDLEQKALQAGARPEAEWLQINAMLLGDQPWLLASRPLQSFGKGPEWTIFYLCLVNLKDSEMTRSITREPGRVLPLYCLVQVPRGATHFVAFAHGPGVLGSEPIASLRSCHFGIQDLRPPTVMPLSIIVNDFSEESGVASFSFSFQPGRCQIDGDETCDAGSGFALYWVVKGQKMGKALWTSETDQVSLAAVAAARPPLATAVMVRGPKEPSCCAGPPL
eukprot:g9239.t1